MKKKKLKRKFFAFSAPAAAPSVRTMIGRATDLSPSPGGGILRTPRPAPSPRGLLIFGGGRGYPRRDVSGGIDIKCPPRLLRGPHGEFFSVRFFLEYVFDFFFEMYNGK